MKIYNKNLCLYFVVSKHSRSAITKNAIEFCKNIFKIFYKSRKTASYTTFEQPFIGNDETNAHQK